MEAPEWLGTAVHRLVTTDVHQQIVCGSTLGAQNVGSCMSPFRKLYGDLAVCPACMVHPVTGDVLKRPSGIPEMKMKNSAVHFSYSVICSHFL